ncbi:DUF3883 domain-containing protein [Winogradskyella tangerina]|uniref:DUF3883 domain-containing protein n=1 Tax=Winogradskyella tangerina TaxID=2023240 RepID=UPI000DBE15BF|nr:DUF3883 domain-containing protein [Winogradskyella tangerina]
MLNDLRKYDCLGTPNYFFELFSTLKSNPSSIWQRPDLEKLFFNRVIDDRPIIDGGIELALRMNVLQQSETSFQLNSDFENYMNSVPQMIDRFNQLLFESLKNDTDFLNIFSSKYLSHDVIYKSLQIDNSAFGFKYSNFKQLLLDFNAIGEHPTPEFKSYIINQRYKKLFDKSVLPEIKKRKIGIEEFRKSMEQQQIYGEEAEKFVLKFETERLENKKKVDWVAEYVVNEGYDIASYNEIEDEQPNRFIEVKSYDGPKAYFYWSRNEYQVAKLKGDKYWIYLVNRSKMRNENYQPIMKQNPFDTILTDNNWNKQVEKYKISLI